MQSSLGFTIYSVSFNISSIIVYLFLHHLLIWTSSAEMTFVHIFFLCFIYHICFSHHLFFPLWLYNVIGLLLLCLFIDEHFCNFNVFHIFLFFLFFLLYLYCDVSMYEYFYSMYEYFYTLYFFISLNICFLHTYHLLFFP